MASSCGGRGSRVQVAAPLQHGISHCREKLAQCQQQRLGGRHLEGRPIAGEQPTLKDAGFVRADRLPERIGYGALQPSIVLHWNKVRVIRPEPGQHVGMNVAVEVVHQERAEDRNVNFFGKLIEQVLEVHAGGDVHAIPGLTFPHPVRFMVKVTVHGSCLRSRNGRTRHGRPYHTRPTANAGPPQYPWGGANSLSIILWCRSASGIRSRVRSANYNSSVHPPRLFRTPPPTDAKVWPIPSSNRFAPYG